MPERNIILFYMLDKYFEAYPIYKTEARPESAFIDRFRNFLPEEVLYLWEHHGWGTTLHGYLKIVNPDDWEDFLFQTYNPLEEPCTLFAVTAMGDLLLWEKDSIIQVNYRWGNSKVVGRKPGVFFNGILPHWDYSSEEMKAEQYLEARKILGEPAFDECFAYVPALALGGPENLENLQIVKVREHLMILSQLAGMIE